MAWDFETDPEYQEELDWVADFVKEEVEPLGFLVKHGYDMKDPVRNALIPPLQEKVKARGLWGCHLGPELGGPGYGQVKLALLNEILGRAAWAPIVFGCQAPDSGNAEILAHYGTPEQKQQWLEPLLDNKIVSCFSMTEPQGGADPKVFRTTAGARRRRVGDQRREVVLVERLVLVVPDRDGDHRPRRPALPADVDVHRADGLAGCRDHPRRRPRLRAGGPRHPRLHALQRRARAGREHARPTAAGRSSSPRRASAAAASTTPCAPSARSRRRST